MTLEYSGVSGQETQCAFVDSDDDGTPYIDQRQGIDMKRVHVSKVLWDETMSGTILVVGKCMGTNEAERH